MRYCRLQHDQSGSVKIFHRVFAASGISASRYGFGQGWDSITRRPVGVVNNGLDLQSFMTHRDDGDPMSGELGRPQAGRPGACALAEYERRVARRRAAILADHPRLGRLILALSSEPMSTQAWATGAEGEARLGSRLDRLASNEILLLHDRRVPGTRGNIDHIVASPTGVFVIDAKRYRGRPRLERSSGLFSPRREILRVGGRNCDRFVDAMHRQVQVVRQVLAQHRGQHDVPVHGVICFIDADWPLVGGAFCTRGVEVMWPRKVSARIRRAGHQSSTQVAATHRILAQSLPAATRE